MFRSRALVPAAFLAAALFLPSQAYSQLVPGQYEDEAPLGSWNRPGGVAAGAAGMGGARFALADDCSTAFANPSLLVSLPGFTASVSASAVFASLYRYSLINTGVLSSRGNPSVGVFAADLCGVSFRWRKWAVSAATALMERYDRPGADVEYFSSGVLSHRLTVDQGGSLRGVNVALAREVTPRLAAGIGLNFISGGLSRDIVEDYVREGVSRRDQKRQDFAGFFVNAGLTWKLSQKLSAALVFRTPHIRRSESRSVLTYDSAAASGPIRIEASARDEYRRPWVAGAGLGLGFAGDWRLAADISFCNWSAYRVRYFDEQLSRDFRNTLKAGAGVEYEGRVRMLGRNLAAPLRAGIIYDQQPMRNPRSAYLALTAGAGVGWDRLVLDLAVDFGVEHGSGRSLKSGGFVASVGYRSGE